ncbi:cardio acceleratory peptide 2b isoform X2 [Melanaphis sacchari]|uniref:Cardio acceleratory peptide 2b n=1 Tax=Melanaphis sacchari TaxID=742174 RepID=A0A2H8TF70_9HEMI|nr:cardio acceleratory peptide 2b isoform X2 [Melanaphis sacchari]
MKNLQTQIIAALLLTLTFFFTHALCHGSEYSDEYKRDNNRDRRESVAGLIPFPRVGRSGIESALQMDNLYDTQQELRSHKREGLIPFPRIGRRSDSKNTALWFGPRLGRSAVVPENYDTSYLDSGTIHQQS